MGRNSAPDDRGPDHGDHESGNPDCGDPDFGDPDAPGFGDDEPDPASVAKAIVYRQLTSSAKSRLQLARKLAERNIPEDVAEAVLDKFQAAGLIDDAEFAAMWVRSRAQSRKLARGALRRELADKGIDQESAETALAQVSDSDEDEAARTLVERKLRSGTELLDRSERDKATRRLASMLARKGYQPSRAFRIVNQVLDERAAGPAGDGPANRYP